MASLLDLKHLATKQRDRVTRIVDRAAVLDRRGDFAEQRFHQHADKHEAFLDTLEEQTAGLEAFNREMERDLGNEPGRLGNGAAPLPGRADPGRLPGQKQEDQTRGTNDQGQAGS